MYGVATCRMVNGTGCNRCKYNLQNLSHNFAHKSFFGPKCVFTSSLANFGKTCEGLVGTKLSVYSELINKARQKAVNVPF